MADKERLLIGYGGSLGSYDGNPRTVSPFRLRDWFWTYRVRHINDYFTRSGYYLFRGVQRLKEQVPDLAEKLQIRLWGLIDELNRQQVEEFGITDIVRIEGYVPKTQSMQRLEECDVLLLPLESARDDHPPYALPGKLFEYLQSGKPILALADPSDCTAILQRAGLGIIVDPRDPEKIAGHLEELIRIREELPQRYMPDRSYIESNFDFKHLTRRLANVFDEVLATTTPQ